MTEGINLYPISQEWTKTDSAGRAVRVNVSAPDSGPNYSISGEALEALLRDAGWAPTEEIR